MLSSYRTRQFFLSQLFVRRLSSKGPRIVVSEPVHFASVSVAQFCKRDIDNCINVLQSVRAKPFERILIKDKFKVRFPKTSSTMLGKWICNSLEDGKTKFPVDIPIDDTVRVSEYKTDIAGAMVTVKKNIENSGVKIYPRGPHSPTYQEALRVTNELYEEIKADRLRAVRNVLVDFADDLHSSYYQLAFKEELASATDVFVDKLEPMLRFLQLPESLIAGLLPDFQGADARRAKLASELASELKVLVHMTESGMITNMKTDHKVPGAPELLSEEENVRAEQFQPHTEHIQQFTEQSIKQAQKKKRRGRRSAQSKSEDPNSETLSKKRPQAPVRPPSTIAYTDSGYMFVRRPMQSRMVFEFFNNRTFDMKVKCFVVGKAGGNGESTYSEFATSTALDSVGNDAISDSSSGASLVQDGSSDNDSSTDFPFEIPPYTVLLDNLPANVNEQILRKALSKCGEIKAMWIHVDERPLPENSRRHRGPKIKPSSANADADADADGFGAKTSVGDDDPDGFEEEGVELEEGEGEDEDSYNDGTPLSNLVGDEFKAEDTWSPKIKKVIMQQRQQLQERLELEKQEREREKIQVKDSPQPASTATVKGLRLSKGLADNLKTCKCCKTFFCSTHVWSCQLKFSAF
jgi:hypothetical protein